MEAVKCGKGGEEGRERRETWRVGGVKGGSRRKEREVKYNKCPGATSN